MLYHPWRELRSLPSVLLRWTEQLPDGVLALTDGRTIWMDPVQFQTERRCTLTHELEHIRRGHTRAVTEHEEQEVRAAAARRLIPIDALADAIAWSRDEHELAEQLWVDLDTVRARLEALDAYETEYVEKVIAAIEEAP